MKHRIPDTAFVKVCNACLRKACADGNLKCSHGDRAGTTKRRVGDLKSAGSTERFEVTVHA